jgi:hypothetical protein
MTHRNITHTPGLRRKTWHFSAAPKGEMYIFILGQDAAPCVQATLSPAYERRAVLWLGVKRNFNSK